MEKTKNLILSLLLFFVPLCFCVSKFAGQETFRTNLIFWGMLAVIAISQSEPIKKLEPGYKALFVLGFIVFVVSRVWEQNSVAAFYQNTMIITGVLFVWRVAKYSDEFTEKAIINAMAIGCLIQSVFCLFDFFGVPGYQKIVAWLFDLHAPNADKKNLAQETVGALGGVARTGGYLALTSVGLLRKRIWPLWGLALFAVWTTGSALAMFGMLGIAGIYAWALFERVLKGKWTCFFRCLPWVGVPAIFLACLKMRPRIFVALENERLKNWDKIAEVLQNHATPEKVLFGQGAGWWNDVGYPASKTTFYWEHSEPLSLFIAFGAFGVVLVGLFLLKIGMTEAKGNKMNFKAAIFAALVMSFGHFVMHQGTAAIVVLCSLAMFMRPRGSWENE